MKEGMIILHRLIVWLQQSGYSFDMDTDEEFVGIMLPSKETWRQGGVFVTFNIPYERAHARHARSGSSTVIWDMWSHWTSEGRFKALTSEIQRCLR